MAFKFNPFTKKLDITDNTVVPPGTVASLQGDVGTAVGPDGSGTIFVKGANNGIVFTGTPINNTLTLTLPGGGLEWIVEPADFTAAAGFGYLILSGAIVNITLPASPLVGDSFIIADVGGNLFKIIQNGGDSVQIGEDFTTTGVAGSLTSTRKGDNLMFVCWASGPGASWIVLQPVGNILIV